MRLKGWNEIYLRRVCNEGVDQELDGEFKWRVLSLLHALLESVSVAGSL